MEANASATFNASGIHELLAIIALTNANYDWFSVVVPIIFLYTSNRNFNIGNKDWAATMQAKKDGNTVTVKFLPGNMTSNPHMWVMAR